MRSTALQLPTGQWTWCWPIIAKLLKKEDARKYLFLLIGDSITEIHIALRKAKKLVANWISYLRQRFETKEET